MVAAESPDVVLLDIGLPDMDGFEVCQCIRSFSKVPILFLTVRDREVDIVKALELGANDYITKPFSHVELLARVQGVLRQASDSAALSQQPPFVSGKLSVDFQRRQVAVDGEIIRLTPTEFHLFCYLLKNAERTITYRTLLQEIWGPEYSDALGYLRVHIQHLQQKLGDSPELPEILLQNQGEECRLVLNPSPGGFSTK